MQKALSSDLKTAAAPAPKKYPPRSPCPNFKKHPLSRRCRNFREMSARPPCQTSKNIRPFRAERTFGKYPLVRISQNSQKISTLPAMTETFGKCPLDRLSRNSQKNPPQPPYPKLSKKHTLARRVRKRKIFTFCICYN